MPPSAARGPVGSRGEAGGLATATAPGAAVLGSVWATAHFLYADFLGTCVACTSTGAATNRSSAEARGSRILTESASEGQGPANGYSSGVLVALPSNPLLHLALDSWSARTGAAPAGSRGHADAALVDLGLAQPGLLDVTAAQASSDSSTSGSGATAATEINGLRMTLGGGAIRLVVLHSEASNHGNGHAYLASLNGVVVLGSGEMAPDGPITVPRVVSLQLLHGGADGAAGAAARDGKSQGVIGLSSGWTGGGATSQPEPLH
jgi:hypothetical protein